MYEVWFLGPYPSQDAFVAKTETLQAAREIICSEEGPLEVLRQAEEEDADFGIYYQDQYLEGYYRPEAELRF